ncbi:MAG TPA: hypothetical protein V6D46_00185 [Coleofasciculaceae cyanobacterium]
MTTLPIFLRRSGRARAAKGGISGAIATESKGAPGDRDRGCY